MNFWNYYISNLSILDQSVLNSGSVWHTFINESVGLNQNASKKGP